MINKNDMINNSKKQVEYNNNTYKGWHNGFIIGLDKTIKYVDINNKWKQANNWSEYKEYWKQV